MTDPLYVYWDPDVSGPMFKLTVVWAVGVAYSFEALLPSFGFSHRTRPPSPVASRATSRAAAWHHVQAIARDYPVVVDNATVR
jgi:hypothetical protein